MKVLTIFSILLISIIVFAYAEDDSHVVTLTSSNFGDVIKQNKYVLVEFYAPWCGHCKRLAPEYELAAKALKDDKDFVLAMVDATVEANLATEFGIRGYPTIKFFKDGEYHSDFTGGRTSAGITSWLKKVTGPASIHIQSQDDFGKFLSVKSLTHVVAYIPEDKVEAYIKAVDSMDFGELTFGHITDSQLTETFEQKQGSIVVYQNGEVINTYTGDLTTEAIKSFIDRKGYPVLEKLHLTQEFATRINKKEKPLVVIGRDTSDKMSLDDQYEFAKKIATESGIDATFTEFISRENPSLARQWGASGTVFPTVFVLRFSNGMPKLTAYNEEKELTYESAVTWLKSCIAGDECDGNVLSEPIPEKNDEPVKVIVGKTFKDIVYDETKDVVVEFYSPTCPHCKRIVEPYNAFGKLYEKDDTVVVAKIDATANTYPDSIPVTGYPTILLFKANDKANPVKFQGGDRTAEKFKEFVEEHRTFKRSDENTKDEL